MVNANSDSRVHDLLIELKRHLMTCRDCRAAMHAKDGSLLCRHTIGLILTTAVQYDGVIPRRIRAHRMPGNWVHACPDLSAHGKTYSLISEPLQVTGMQEGLW